MLMQVSWLEVNNPPIIHFGILVFILAMVISYGIGIRLYKPINFFALQCFKTTAILSVCMITVAIAMVLSQVLIFIFTLNFESLNLSAVWMNIIITFAAVTTVFYLLTMLTMFFSFSGIKEKNYFSDARTFLPEKITFSDSILSLIVLSPLILFWVIGVSIVNRMVFYGYDRMDKLFRK